MKPVITIADALTQAAARLREHSDTPRLDAEVLLLTIVGKDRSYLRAWPERELAPDDAKRYADLIGQRAQGAPVAYLTGIREFWSRPFRVSEAVLIPRPETELLVEQALRLLPPATAGAVLDLGTGSGIIAVTLAAERPHARVHATDISPDALAIARRNAEQLTRNPVDFFLGDWFAALPERQTFDLIVSNPPYIAQDDPHLRHGDVRREPTVALISGPFGLDALRIIATGARSRLNEGGMLLLEHGYNQAEAVATLLEGLGYDRIAHHLDLQGHRRAISALRP